MLSYDHTLFLERWVPNPVDQMSLFNQIQGITNMDPGSPTYIHSIGTA